MVLKFDSIINFYLVLEVYISFNINSKSQIEVTCDVCLIVPFFSDNELLGVEY